MLEVKHYFLDNEGNVWADIYSNGRRTWDGVIDRDGYPLLYNKLLELENSEHGKATGRRMLTDFYHKNGHEKYMAKLPHIEDASKPMQEAWYGANAGDGPFSGAGYYLDDEQFKEDYGMTVEEFDEQIESDIKKYGIDGEIFERRYNDDCLYSVTWWLCEYFTETVKDGHHSYPDER